jgi:hypothetical protein
MKVTNTPLRITAPSRATVDSAAAQGPNIPCHGVLIKAICPGQTIYVGVDANVTTATGFPLNDGDVLDLRVTNVNQLGFVASADTQSVALLPYALY